MFGLGIEALVARLRRKASAGVTVARVKPAANVISDPVSPQLRAAIDLLRQKFEGGIALYVERGVLMVRVSKIRAGPYENSIAVQVDEVPTLGLEDPLIRPFGGNGQRPLQWQIGSGAATFFSDECWAMGYGGWTLYFDPRLLQDFVTMAASWDDKLCPYARYKLSCDFLLDRVMTQKQCIDLFPE